MLAIEQDLRQEIILQPMESAIRCSEIAPLHNSLRVEDSAFRCHVFHF